MPIVHLLIIFLFLISASTCLETNSIIKTNVRPNKTKVYALVFPNNTAREFKIAAIFRELAYGDKRSKASLNSHVGLKEKSENDSESTTASPTTTTTISTSTGTSFIANNRIRVHKLYNEPESFKDIYLEQEVVPASVVSNSIIQSDILRRRKYMTPEIDPSDIYQAKPASLVREFPRPDVNFSIPQLHVSTSTTNTKGSGLDYGDYTVTTKTPKFHLETRPNVNHTILIHPNPIPRNISRKIFLGDILPSSKSNSGGKNVERSSIWGLRSADSNSWNYHDYVIVAIFTLASFLPIFVLMQINYLKRNHITPTYCNILMINLLTVTINRVVIHCIDPFSKRNIIPYPYVVFLHTIAQCCLVFCIGLFSVILSFPIYRPKSRIIPGAIAVFFFLLYIAKFSIYLSILLIFYSDDAILEKLRQLLGAINLGEIGAISICFIIMNLCTRQRHKIWWIRIYKKSITTSNNSFSVLYSQLKRSIRFGIAASLCQLINSFLIVRKDYGIPLPYTLLNSLKFPLWIEQSVTRGFECFVVLFLVLGVSLRYVTEQRSIIRKRGSVRHFIDTLRCRRRGRSYSTGDKPARYPLGIFTINRGRKSMDYATTDFQLVWSQNNTLPMTSLVGQNGKQEHSVSSSIININSKNEKRNIARSLKSLSSGLTDPFSNERKKPHQIKHSRSFDMLESKSEIPRYSLDIYDNLEFPKNKTPIYQNQYFHYDYKTKLHETSYTTLPNKVHQNGYAPMAATSQTCNVRKKNKKQPRAVSMVETKSNDNYLTSYFSVLSMDNFNDYENCQILPDYLKKMRQSSSQRSSSFQSEEAINSPLVSDDRWKDIKITPKSCTIKVRTTNGKKELMSSKSVDLF